MWVLYGISNCDSVKKARAWLQGRNLDYRFHDYRKDGLDAALLQRFIDAHGLQPLLNRRGATWRQLSAQCQAALQAGDVSNLLQAPTLLKRPILDADGRIIVGFSEAEYAGLTHE